MTGCSHEPKVAAVCAHVGTAPEYCEWFTGRGVEHHLLCAACADRPEAAAVTPVCAACTSATTLGRAWNADRGVLGRPGASERDGGLAFVHERVGLPRLSASILELQPAPGPAPVFYAFLDDARIVRLDLAARAVTPVADVGHLNLHRAERSVALAVAPLGDAIAVVSDEGARGAVFAVDGGQETVALARGDFRPGDRFPIAMAENEGRSVVIHGTRWNRLDVSDALSGELLSARSYGEVAEGEQPPHYLPLRHGRLAVAPDGDLVADAVEGEDGLARVATFSLRRMLGADPWESEGGERRREHCPRWYAPDPSLAWLDERHLAVWGYGPSAGCLIDAVVVCDAETGSVSRWFPGPHRGELVFAGPHLLAYSADGTAVWDPIKGERLLHDPGFAPQRYHHGAGAFLSTNPRGELFVLSRLTARM